MSGTVKILTRTPSVAGKKVVSENNQNTSNYAGLSSSRAGKLKQSFKKNLEVIKSTTEQINELAGQDKIKMPESIFVKYFLPMFANEEGMYPPNAHEEWLKISRNGFSPVTIVNDNGEEVIVVPAKYSRALISVRTNRDRLSIFEAMETFKDLAVSSPVRARNYFDNVMHPPTAQNSEREKYANKWQEDIDKVLAHYGKKIESSNNNEKERMNKNVQLNYDDSDML